MNTTEYNYAIFDYPKEIHVFPEFPKASPHAGDKALDFPVEDLSTGETVRLSECWSGGVAIIEFGSYT